MVQQLTVPAAENPVVTPPVVEVPVVAAAPVVPQGAPTPEPQAASPVAPQPAAPVITPEAQAYIEELEQGRQAAQQQADVAAVQTTVAQLTTQYETKYGITREQAAELAQENVGRTVRIYQEQQFRIGQANAASAIAEEYKVDPRHLRGLPTERAMRQTAEAVARQGAASQRVAALEAEVSRLKRAPVQTFANGAVGGDGTGNESLWRSYGRGEVNWSPQVQQAGKALGII